MSPALCPGVYSLRGSKACRVCADVHIRRDSGRDRSMWSGVRQPRHPDCRLPAFLPRASRVAAGAGNWRHSRLRTWRWPADIAGADDRGTRESRGDACCGVAGAASFGQSRWNRDRWFKSAYPAHAPITASYL